MNNEQKASELANSNMRYYGGEYDSYRECRNSAIEMGIWKDEQFKKQISEYIEVAYNNGEPANLLENLLAEI